jgi:hypothetical protein
MPGVEALRSGWATCGGADWNWEVAAVNSFYR